MGNHQSTPAFPVWDLGKAENHVTLRNYLHKYPIGKFAVTSSKEELELAVVRRFFDDGVDHGRRGVLHGLLRDGDHEEELRLLLSVGVEPDKPNKDNFRPSHEAACWGRQACARALAPCRPDLSAVNCAGDTPLTARVWAWDANFRACNEHSAVSARHILVSLFNVRTFIRVKAYPQIIVICAETIDATM
jgi:hypothetical protein